VAKKMKSTSEDGPRSLWSIISIEFGGYDNPAAQLEGIVLGSADDAQRAMQRVKAQVMHSYCWHDVDADGLNFLRDLLEVDGIEDGDEYDQLMEAAWNDASDEQLAAAYDQSDLFTGEHARIVEARKIGLGVTVMFDHD
jgi:hypothetical protein